MKQNENKKKNLLMLPSILLLNFDFWHSPFVTEHQRNQDQSQWRRVSMNETSLAYKIFYCWRTVIVKKHLSTI